MANKDLVNSLLRGMDMVKLVSRAPRGMRLNEIAQAMELKVPTAYNLLRTLQAGGFLDRRDNLFFVGRELATLARNSDAGLFGILSEKALFSLYRQFSDLILIFGVAQEDGLAQTLRMSFDRPGVVQHLDHELLHPYASAAGLVGLAFADPAGATLQEERRPFAEFGAGYWKNREELETFLAKVRQDRYAISPFDRDRFFRITAGIFDGRERLIAAIGASSPGNISEKRIAELREKLIDSAKILSTQLSRA